MGTKWEIPGFGKKTRKWWWVKQVTSCLGPKPRLFVFFWCLWSRFGPRTKPLPNPKFYPENPQKPPRLSPHKPHN
jgi:hypothetical protein